jgi:hypothetical protein
LVVTFTQVVNTFVFVLAGNSAGDYLVAGTTTDLAVLAGK